MQSGYSQFSGLRVQRQMDCGVAWRKSCPMFYIMAFAVLDGFADRLGKSRTGISCVEYRETRKMPLATLDKLIDGILAETARRLDANS